MKMEVTCQPKYNIILLFLSSLVTGTTSGVTDNDSVSKPLQSGKLSDVQEHVGLQWPMGVVTYFLDTHAYDNFVSDRIRTAMNTLESASCMRFKRILVKPTGNMTWIHITNPAKERNCVHEPTHKKDGEIVLVIGFDCLKNREILHTILHAIGFKDEVSHPHRDQYIRVLWNNIRPDYRYLYRIQTGEEMSSTLLVEYDPSSVMHFHDRAFSMNGRATLMPLIPGLQISPSSGLSQLDKMRLRLLFDRECNKRTVGSVIDTCKMVLSNNMKAKVVKDGNGKNNGTEKNSIDSNENKVTEKDFVDNNVKNKTTNDNLSIAEDADDVDGEGENKGTGKDSINSNNKHKPTNNNELTAESEDDVDNKDEGDNQGTGKDSIKSKDNVKLYMLPDYYSYK